MLGRFLLGCWLVLTPAAMALGAAAVPVEILTGAVSIPPTADGKQPGTPTPFQFAVPRRVSLSPASHGLWRLDGEIARWQLDIRSPGARSMNAGIEQLVLPVGAEIRVSDPQGQVRHGPWRREHLVAGQLWTPVVPGEVLRLEVTVPLDQRALLSFSIHQIGHGFHDFWKSDGLAGKCNLDVVCPVGDGWRDQIRAVARYTVDGQYLCTGTLVNNVLQDLSPYFLTAGHCVSSSSAAYSMVLYWNYEASSCGGERDGALDQTQSGAVLLLSTDVRDGDLALVRLALPPNPTFDVFYSGWDASPKAPDNVAAIHHPAGTEKRISLEFDALSVTDLYEDQGRANGNFLRVADWDLGTTEPGSSGSGIWDAERRLVGTLTGGAAACGNNASDWYGHFYRHWEAGAGLFLDPLGVSGGRLDGLDPVVRVVDLVRLPDAPDTGAGAPFWLLLSAVLLGRRRQRRPR